MIDDRQIREMNGEVAACSFPVKYGPGSYSRRTAQLLNAERPIVTALLTQALRHSRASDSHLPAPNPGDPVRASSPWSFAQAL